MILLVIPLIPVIVVAVSGAIGATIAGLKKQKDIKDREKRAVTRDANYRTQWEGISKRTCEMVDRLGTYELQTVADFGEFSTLFKKLHNRPIINELKIDKFTVPPLDMEELIKVSNDASTVVSTATGVALGTLGAFAISSVTKILDGTTTTGKVITALTSSFITNTTLTTLGGEALITGGSGVALGVTALGGIPTLGIGLLVGSMFFLMASSKQQKKVTDIERDVQKEGQLFEKAYDLLYEVQDVAQQYYAVLQKAHTLYMSQIDKMKTLLQRSTDWNTFTAEEKLIVDNTVLLVSVIYNMCKVPLIRQTSSKEQPNEINTTAIVEVRENTRDVIDYFEQQ